MCFSDFFDGDKPFVGQNKLSLSNTGQLCLFPFLSKMAVLTVLYHVAMEHSAGGGTVNVTVACKNIHAPFFASQESTLASMAEKSATINFMPFLGTRAVRMS